MAKVLFVCLHNAGDRRSARRCSGGRGCDPRGPLRGDDAGDGVHPEVVEVMRELDVDLWDRVPRKLSDEDARGRTSS